MTTKRITLITVGILAPMLIASMALFVLLQGDNDTQPQAPVVAVDPGPGTEYIWQLHT